MDFSKLRSTKATPPAGTGPAASGNSPLQPELKNARKDGEWHKFSGIGTQVVGTRKNKSDGKSVDIHEYQALCDEIKRAARQLDYGVNIRVEFTDDPKTVNVYFRCGDKRKYERRTNTPGESASK